MYEWNFKTTSDNTLPPLLLLHGWLGTCGDYDRIVDRLKSHFYCIALDLPGHGKTQVLNGDLGYNFIDTAIGIIDFIDRLKIERLSISGYSFGGRLALYLALEFPDRFDRIVLESTSPGLLRMVDRQARIASDRQIIDRLNTESFADFIADWYRQPIFTGIDRHPDFKEMMQRRIDTNQPDSPKGTLCERVAKSLQYSGLGMQPYLGNRLKLHPHPISWIVGELDRKFVEIGTNLQQECPQIELSIVPNCSHNIHFQQPQAWVDILMRSPSYVVSG